MGFELHMSFRKITNVAEPTYATTIKYVVSVLAHKKLGNQLFLPLRTTNLFQEQLNDAAEPTLKLIFHS
jgi:hypothetical protein